MKLCKTYIQKCCYVQIDVPVIKFYVMQFKEGVYVLSLAGRQNAT